MQLGPCSQGHDRTASFDCILAVKSNTPRNSLQANCLLAFLNCVASLGRVQAAGTHKQRPGQLSLPLGSVRSVRRLLLDPFGMHCPCCHQRLERERRHCQHDDAGTSLLSLLTIQEG